MRGAKLERIQWCCNSNIYQKPTVFQTHVSFPVLSSFTISECTLHIACHRLLASSCSARSYHLVLQTWKLPSETSKTWTGLCVRKCLSWENPSCLMDVALHGRYTSVLCTKAKVNPTADGVFFYIRDEKNGRLSLGLASTCPMTLTHLISLWLSLL